MLRFEYTVAWIDSLATGRSLGRGLLIRGNHAPGRGVHALLANAPRISVPMQPPFPVVNRLSLRLFNSTTYAKQRRREVRSLVDKI